MQLFYCIRIALFCIQAVYPASMQGVLTLYARLFLSIHHAPMMMNGMLSN